MITGITIREATVDDAAGLARVHVDSWRTTYPGIVPDAHLKSLSHEHSENKWREFFATTRPFVYVAVNSERMIVGFASGGKEREGVPGYDGELYAIYLLKEYQRQGIGRALVLAIAQRLAESNLYSVLVWVLADNPSRKFYEALCVKYVREKEVVIGSANLIDVAYGWRDVRVLLG